EAALRGEGRRGEDDRIHLGVETAPQLGTNVDRRGPEKYPASTALAPVHPIGGIDGADERQLLGDVAAAPRDRRQIRLISRLGEGGHRGQRIQQCRKLRSERLEAVRLKADALLAAAQIVGCGAKEELRRRLQLERGSGEQALGGVGGLAGAKSVRA